MDTPGDNRVIQPGKGISTLCSCEGAEEIRRGQNRWKHLRPSLGFAVTTRGDFARQPSVLISKGPHEDPSSCLVLRDEAIREEEGKEK